MNVNFRNSDQEIIIIIEFLKASNPEILLFQDIAMSIRIHDLMSYVSTITYYFFRNDSCRSKNAMVTSP